MKVYNGLNELAGVEHAVVTTGTFDGVHLGHQTIIDRLKEIASNENGETVIFTFNPHPRHVLFPDTNDLKLLNTLEEKIELLDKAGIDHLIIYPFSKEFSRLSATEYARDVLVGHIGTKKLVIGYDHRFGKNREGDFNQLLEFGALYNFQVEEIPAKEINDVNISSTKIRRALGNGDLSTARSYLGYDYMLSGNVVQGDHLGRTLGFPTANIEVSDPHKLVPGNGIYAVRVHISNSTYNGMLSIGIRPTINSAGVRTIEVNLFDFNRDIYGQRIGMEFVSLLRSEKKFDSLEELTREMGSDKIRALNALA